MTPHALFPAIVVTVLFFAPAAGWTEDTYVPTPDEEFYGTWTSEAGFPPRMIESADGMFNEYYPASNTKPFRGGTAEIARKWTGSDGGIYYYVLYTNTFGTEKGRKTAWLCRVSESGKVLEMMWHSVGLTLDPAKMPTEIDPKDSHYRVYSRAEE